MIFSKRIELGYDLFCTIWKGGIFSQKHGIFSRTENERESERERERERRLSSRNTRKHGIFYLICSTPTFQKKIKDDPIPQKVTDTLD